MGIHGKLLITFLLTALLQLTSVAQNPSSTLRGVVLTPTEVATYSTVGILELNKNASTDHNGEFVFTELPAGTYRVAVYYPGYETDTVSVTLIHQATTRTEIKLKNKQLDLNEFVVTGSKTVEYKKNSAILVSTLSHKSLENIQACNLSDGLKFQPGLRVENNCQTCNYTQLRMNGLAGGYSQILINGRPIFSPLTGLYGLEQLPTAMVERIEVVKGGGSSLYGSSAVGGTVNVITKLPKANGYNLTSTYNQIGKQANEFQISGDANIVADNDKSGITFFLNKRQRDFYDHNDDNFSELPALDNTAIGLNTFILPKENQKLEISLSYLNEYRFGGEMIDGPAYIAEQAEERTHRVWMGTADYQINSADGKSSLISYLAWQHTDRDHYTGVIPDEELEKQEHYANAPYGTSAVTTYNAGVQANHRLSNFLKGENILTLGAEYIYDDVNDQIDAYNYLIDQTTQNAGFFAQSNWKIRPQLILLSGLRLDVHNLLEEPMLNPRLAALWKPKQNTQVRLNYAQGFRAPQAFDTDLHIAFAGGGISRVQLSPNLAPETSESWSASISSDLPSDKFIVGFTLEGFHTVLQDAFFLQPIGEDAFGQVFEKQNGQGATVQGLTLELRANYNRILQLESGFTVQSSVFEEAVQYIDELPGIKPFIRTPNQYGFASLTYTPNKKVSANLNYVYTGNMKVPHFAGAPNQLINEIIHSEVFHELSGKVSYLIQPKELETGVEVFAGVRNGLNAYQASFDIGKNRDSNFVYGPALPRTVFVGVKVIGL
jgi:outer membrane receptor for ferrienterochelin and colicins